MAITTNNKPLMLFGDGLNKIERRLDHQSRMAKIKVYGHDGGLNPDRICNRAMFGTDYHPDDVNLNIGVYMRRWRDILRGTTQQAMDDMFYGGLGMVDHSYDHDGSISIRNISPREYMIS